ncbi:MAG: alpha amylase C-terminal domain-containing protein [Acidobacteria bacterium]|nr:alpha amylase C-terminal domain-containing protein [Acidobacteriota bacterium]
MPGDNGVPLLAIANFTPVPRNDYRLGVPEAGTWRALLNTDAACYGGSDFNSGGEARAEPVPWRDWPASLALALPPLATLILRLDEAPP